MDFSRLPDNVFLQIFEYLPMEDCARVCRVDKSFHRMYQSTISRTKCFDLTDYRFRKLTAEQLAVILDLCSPNLKSVKFPYRIPAAEMASILANYECPRLTDIIFWNTPIDSAVFEQLIRNNSNLESLRSHAPFVGFPMVTSNNLKKLYLCDVNDAALQSMTGRIPNLEELDLIDTNVTANVLNAFFASSLRIQRVMLRFVEGDQILFDDSLVNFWNLPLTSLTINLDSEVDLQKVAASFPHLQTLLMSVSNPSTHGISALAALQELRSLQLDIPKNATDDNDHEIRALVACKQLRILRLSASVITAGSLVTLLRSCPKLEYILVSDIDQVETPDEAAAVLESLSGIAKRDHIVIFFDRDDAEMEEWFQSIWVSEAVEQAIKNLEQNKGFKIRIDWLYRPVGDFEVEEMTE